MKMEVVEAYNILIKNCKDNDCDQCDLYETRKFYPEETCLAKHNVAPCFWKSIERTDDKCDSDK
jgi:hypothetical protein